ncbi:MAG: hypothetical protein P1U85_16120 [Verrucomicrobiales bacterium]|nr:hypothetical protein [Verrucomicrobiales bacterium]
MKSYGRRPVGYALVLALLAFCSGRVSCAVEPEDFYEQRGRDEPFAEILRKGDLKRGAASHAGVEGSKIRVNDSLLRDGPNADRRIPSDLFLHTLGSTRIHRGEFDKWSRWYQEDGNTQVFRLFEGEENRASSRKLAARVESFVNLGPASETAGEWHEWVGTYTLIKPHGAMIFQSKNSENDWSVSINMNDDGNIRLNHRRGQDRSLASNMIGKPFHLRVRDNGLDYEVFLNGHQVGTGQYPRPKGTNSFRWGMYLGANEVRHDAMIFVTGAEVNPRKVDESGLPDLTKSPGEGSREMSASEEETKPEVKSLPERTWTNLSGSEVTTTARYSPGSDRISLQVRGQWIEIEVNQLSSADREFLKSMSEGDSE